jgi:hypothetical protein
MSKATEFIEDVSLKIGNVLVFRRRGEVLGVIP